ncbi:M67 family metallopeptidase [Clostridium sp. JNZ X4-2]
MIYIYKLQYEKILKQARDEFPNECCGYLGGLNSGKDIFIKKIYSLTNTDHSSDHFSMDPAEQFRAVKLMRSEKFNMIGNYHSHPYSPSRPSEEDKRLAFDDKILYGILSLEKEEPVFNLFKIDKNKNVEKIKYKIV